MAEIIGEIQPGELQVKHFYLPGVVIRDTCPNCGKECSVDLGKVSMEYPIINKPTELGMYCGYGCEHEWEIPVLFQMSLKIL